MKTKKVVNETQPTEVDLTRKQLAEQKAARNKAINERLDTDYDGYYNDIEPIETGSKTQELNKEMIKKVALIGAGAVGIIVLAILFMLFL